MEFQIIEIGMWQKLSLNITNRKKKPKKAFDDLQPH